MLRTCRTARSTPRQSPREQRPQAGTAKSRRAGVNKATHALEVTIDHSRKAALGVSGAQQLRSSRWRKGQRDHTRNNHGAGQSERELAEQRTRQPPWIPMGAYTAASVMVIAMIGPTSSRAASMAARYGVFPAGEGAARRSPPSQSRHPPLGRPTARSPAKLRG